MTRRVVGSVLLALVLSLTAVGGLQEMHRSTASEGSPADGSVAVMVTSAHGHDPAAAGHDDAAAAAGHDATAAGHDAAATPLLHWLRDASLAVPAVLAGLQLGAALSRRVLPGKVRRSVAAVIVGRSVASSAALATASPGHGLLFEEGEAGVAALVRVFAVSLPLTLGTLMGVAALTGAVHARGRVGRAA